MQERVNQLTLLIEQEDQWFKQRIHDRDLKKSPLTEWEVERVDNLERLKSERRSLAGILLQFSFATRSISDEDLRSEFRLHMDRSDPLLQALKRGIGIHIFQANDG